MQICEYNYKIFFLSFQRKHREVLLEREAEQKHNASMTHYFKPSSVTDTTFETLLLIKCNN